VLTQGDTTLDFQQATGGTCIGTITAWNCSTAPATCFPAR
jgi:hypothetical protein